MFINYIVLGMCGIPLNQNYTNNNEKDRIIPPLPHLKKRNKIKMNKRCL